MIQIIGLMIGAYIFTRMLHLATTPTAKSAVRVMAVLTLVFDLLMVVLLFAGGHVPQVPPLLR